MHRILVLISTAGALVCGAAAQDRDRVAYPNTIPPGVTIDVRTNQGIEIRDRSDGRVFTGTVASDVFGPDGRMLIPRGAQAELIVQNIPHNEMAIDLESVTVEGRRYMVDAQTYNLSRRTGVGANKRTGEYVGGGALFGSIVGAIAGGGKGAAIGALAGGATGAGVQTATKGPAIYVAAETILPFRLEQPLTIGRGRFERDNGYDTNGYHYHNDYYRRQQ